MEHSKFLLRVIDGEVDSNILEGRYLPSSSALKSYHKYKSFVTFYCELNDHRWERNLTEFTILFATTQIQLF